MSPLGLVAFGVLFIALGFVFRRGSADPAKGRTAFLLALAAGLLALVAAAIRVYRG